MTTQLTQASKIKGYCCYCGRTAIKVVNSGAKDGALLTEGEREGYPTPIFYKTSKNHAVCERCVATHTIAIGLGGKPVVGYERVGGYYVVHPDISKLVFELVTPEEGY